MIMPIKFSLVVPTYNEKVNVQRLYQEIAKAFNLLPFDSELIIVDDNSPDRTWEVAEVLAKQDKRVRVIRRMKERGLASAVVSGWAIAQGEILGVIDADLQHPPQVLVEMLKKLLNDQEVDIILASKYVAGAGILGRSFWQSFKSKFAIFLGLILVPRIFRLVKDPMSGYFILRKKVINDKILRPLGYKILLEVLAMGSYKKILEIPYIFAIRQNGQTKANLKQCLLYLRHLASLINRGNKVDSNCY